MIIVKARSDYIGLRFWTWNAKLWTCR